MGWVRDGIAWSLFVAGVYRDMRFVPFVSWAIGISITRGEESWWY